MSGLRPIELHVLMALATGPLHGYALVKRIEADSEGRLQVLPGNLYTVLHRLSASGLLRESRAQPKAGEDQRRRCFELTAGGRKALEREARHLEGIVERLRTLATDGAGPGGRT